MLISLSVTVAIRQHSG